MTPDVYDRQKQAFSDAVSSFDKPWYKVIEEYVDNIYSNEQYEEKIEKYEFNKPYSKESLYYRELFEKYYGGHSNVIPYFWVHPFTNKMEPSAWAQDDYINEDPLDTSQKSKTLEK